MTLQVCIMTPDRVFLNKEVEEKEITTVAQETSGFSGYAPLLGVFVIIIIAVSVFLLLKKRSGSEGEENTGLGKV